MTVQVMWYLRLLKLSTGSRRRHWSGRAKTVGSAPEPTSTRPPDQLEPGHPIRSKRSSTALGPDFGSEDLASASSARRRSPLPGRASSGSGCSATRSLGGRRWVLCFDVAVPHQCRRRAFRDPAGLMASERIHVPSLRFLHDGSLPGSGCQVLQSDLWPSRGPGVTSVDPREVPMLPCGDDPKQETGSTPGEHHRRGRHVATHARHDDRRSE